MEEDLLHIADRYSALDIADILGISEQFDPDDLEDMSSEAMVKVYKRQIMSKIGEFI